MLLNVMSSMNDIIEVGQSIAAMRFGLVVAPLAIHHKSVLVMVIGLKHK